MSRVLAWKVTDTLDDSWLLVFERSRGKAKSMALHAGLWGYDDYICIRATRAPEWDGARDVAAVVERNKDLPPGYPPFYSDYDEDDLLWGYIDEFESLMRVKKGTTRRWMHLIQKITPENWPR